MSTVTIFLACLGGSTQSYLYTLPKCHDVVLRMLSFLLLLSSTSVSFQPSWLKGIGEGGKGADVLRTHFFLWGQLLYYWLYLNLSQTWVIRTCVCYMCEMFLKNVNLSSSVSCMKIKFLNKTSLKLKVIREQFHCAYKTHHLHMGTITCLV